MDYVNLMTYDFREAGGDAAGHHANLFLNPADDRQQSTDRAAREFLEAGVPSAKLVLGVPFYGRAWGDVGADAHGLYQPASKPVERIDTSYGQIAATLVGRDGFVRYWDPERAGAVSVECGPPDLHQLRRPGVDAPEGALHPGPPSGRRDVLAVQR